MKNYIENIELINNYLNKNLSEIQIQNFENRLETDSDFNTLFDEHITILEGLKRQQLKVEILKGKQACTRIKWLKFLGVSIIILTITAFIYIITSKPSEPIQNKNLENKSVEVNTVLSKKSIDTLIKNTEPAVLKDTVFSKKEVVKVKILETIKNAETPYKKAPQKFRIDAQKDTVLLCNEGTKLKIKANSFINNSGNIIKGNIDLSVTEYYKLSDILLANLSTTSDGDQLETGGMLFVEAFNRNQPLNLNLGIEISFPTKNKKDSMQLFSGERINGNINWKLQDESVNQDLEILEIEPIAEQTEVPFSVIETPPIYPGCENLDKFISKKCTSDAISKFVRSKFNTGVSDILGLTGRQRVNVIFKINQKGKAIDIRARSTSKELEEEAIRVISLLPKMEAGKQRGKVVTVPYSLPIIFTVGGNVNNGNSSFSFKNIIYDTIYKQARGQVERIREVMHDKDFEVDSSFVKTWETYKSSNLIRFINSTNDNRKVILRKPLFDMGGTRFRMLDDDSISRGGHVIRELWNETKVPTTSISMMLKQRQNINIGNEIITDKEFEKRLESEIDTSIKTNSVNAYVLRTLGLGWINCDRFVRGNSLIKYRFKVNDAYDAKVSMIFKSVYSILPSRRSGSVYDFKMVSENEDVTLVAIKKHEGRLYLDIVDAKTEENPNLDFNFKEVSLEEMKNELEKLNKSF